MKPNLRQTRFVFIDGLRGIAALLVAACHLYATLPVREPIASILPSAVACFLQNSHLAVYIFFVISGFVIAYSLRNANVDCSFFIKFTLRRSIRLDPVYWTAIFLALLINWSSNFIIHDRSATLLKWNELILNMLYLQNFLGVKSLLAGIDWTLCIEIQFYLLFVLLLGITQRLIKNSLFQSHYIAYVLVFTPLALISVVSIRLLDNMFYVLFIPCWCMFFLGVITWWVLEQRITSSFYWLYIIIITTSLIIHWDIRLCIALVTGCTVYCAGKYNKLYTWLNAACLQYLGKISYSLYLIHIVLGKRIVNFGYRFVKDSPILCLFLYLSALLLTVLASHLMYLLVEKNSVELSKKIKY